MKNNTHVNIVSAIDCIPTDTVNKLNNTNVKTRLELVGETAVEIVYDLHWINDYSTGYDLTEENSCTIKREHDELFYGTDSKFQKLFNDINNMEHCM